jgi:hypothetical protein
VRRAESSSPCAVRSQAREQLRGRSADHAARRSGRRYFTSDILDRLALVALCQEVGFTIAEIGHLFGNGVEARQRWQQLAQQKLGEIDAQISRAQTMKALLRAAAGREAFQCRWVHLEAPGGRGLCTLVYPLSLQ